MKILWLTNIPLPEASILMKENPSPFGGWLVNASSAFASNKNINLSIAFPKKGIKKFRILKGENITYYPFSPINIKDVNLLDKKKNLDDILNKTKPNLVHIFGTEFPHTLSMVKVCKSKGIKTVISIQGIVSIYAEHYMACLPHRVQVRFTLRDFILQDNLKQQKKKFAKRGQYEIEALKEVNHVIGRTTWDKACTSQINQNIEYHHCNETLRNEFYKHKWDLNKCERHSIFVSQGSYPIKGLHFMLKAMPFILDKYPDAKLYIGGHNIVKSDNFKEKIKMSSYGKYIKELIKKYNLKENVIFTGLLNEKQMCDHYLKANVFVSPSSIENSPNSLGEAMILGVPSVASDVGGVSDMMVHKKEGFVYQMDAPYMLAHYVNEIFSNENLAMKLSKNARAHALKTHDIENNTKRLLEIYNTIIQT